jgi:hypothetical protein
MAMGIGPIIGGAAQVTGAIRQAAASTGMSFEYLLTTAQIESNLNPAAQAATSSAKGLYQFIDQTWLATMKSTGASLGYGRYADAIVQNADGQYEVPDPQARNAIMKLRSDPAASALMAGAFTRGNAAQLANALGRAPSEGELYIAHFLGPDGARKLISAATSQPQTSGAAMFPQAAAANPSIFYNGSGSARSAQQVYAKLTSRFEVARSLAFDASLRGSLGATDNATDTAGVTQAFAAASKAPAVADTRPRFQAMFTDRARAITNTVSELWTPASTDADKKTRPLNLFSDGPSDPRKLFGS